MQFFTWNKKVAEISSIDCKKPSYDEYFMIKDNFLLLWVLVRIVSKTYVVGIHNTFLWKTEGNYPVSSNTLHIWAASCQNWQNGMCAQRRLDQPGHPPSLISLRCPHEESLGPQLPNERTVKTWSDWADAQADLCLRWTNMPFCWFCHA